MDTLCLLDKLLSRLFGLTLLLKQNLSSFDAGSRPRVLSAEDQKRFYRHIRIYRLLYGHISDNEWVNNVRRLGKSIMGKRLRDGDASKEAFTMEYISQHTTIPVPRVHGFLKLPDETSWIVIDYIEGTPLDLVWLSLSEQERLDCMHQLQGYVAQLRDLPPPDPNRVQAVDRGHLYDARMHGRYGPYDSIAVFHEAWGHSYIPTAYPRYKDDFDKITGKSWRIVFAHGDLGPHNILWRDGKIVAIIDWENGGWLPEYWDYTRAWECTFTKAAGEDWWNMLQKFWTRYPDELEVEMVLDNVLERF
ncbi:kinase-like domain-containing protein [Abortiporus biennis]|nr:kinase-like domain-containing protein [Abortiporus biennis]